MKPGDLVQTNIFNKDGSGSYGLITAKHSTPNHWVVQWCSEEWEYNYGLIGSYEVHEKDLVIISKA
tara:strand:+ start:181 stop:378 length:198 start_codon:yes stop_codon:yes gene_type:complete